MLAYGVTEEEIRDTVRLVSSTLYGGNVTVDIRGMRGRAVRFGLRVKDSRGNGAHRSAFGRRTRSACWHAHADFFRSLFYLAPDARIKTAMADYRGADGFRRDYVFTGMQNVGSMVRPVQLRECCCCYGAW